MTTSTFPAETRDFAIRRRIWRIAWGLLALASLLLLFTRALARVDEGRYAEVAREMIASGGDFWGMRLMGVRYYEKPPMTYWMSAGAMKLLGVRDAAARLPLLLGMVATLGLCHRWTRREWGSEAARTGRAILFSSIGFLVAMGILLTDPALVLFFTATCLFLFEAYRPGAKRSAAWLTAAAAAAGCGVLTKGFVAIVLPGAILFLWLLWERRARDLWRWSLVPVGLLFLAALAAALAHIERHNPEFNHRFIVLEHLARFMGTRPDQGHEEPFWYFVPVVLVLLCPWVFFVPRALRGIRANRDLKTDSFSRFLVVWAAVVFLFFSASTGKLMSYILPMVPPMALLIARRGLLPGRSETDAVDRRLWAFGSVLPLLCPLGIAVFWALARTGAIRGDFGAPRWIAAAPVAAGAGIWLWVWIRGHWKTVPGLLLSVAAAYAPLGFLFSPLSGPEFLVGIEDNRAFYREVSRHVGPADVLLLCNKHNPALAFYLERIPWMYRIRNELADGLAMEPDRPGIFRTAAALDAAMRGDPYRKHFAVLRKEHRAALALQGIRFDPEILAQDREWLLLRLRLP